MKNRKVKEDSDNEDNKKEEGFGDNLEQAQYKRSPMQIPKINMLFQITRAAMENRN